MWPFPKNGLVIVECRTLTNTHCRFAHRYHIYEHFQTRLKEMLMDSKIISKFFFHTRKCRNCRLVSLKSLTPTGEAAIGSIMSMSMMPYQQLIFHALNFKNILVQRHNIWKLLKMSHLNFSIWKWTIFGI